ncbi:Protein argonaute 16 [Glycine max]|nr:Protein argonaute 16 [Glycine max]
MEVAITRAKGGMTEEVPGIVEAAEPPTSSQSPADVPHNLETEQMTPTKYSIISRNGVGTTGKHIPLLVNLFEVAVNVPDTVFFQYSVAITFEDKQAVESKGIGRKVIDRLYQTYSSELGGKRFVYDGGKTLYTVGPLPLNKYEFKVLLEKSFTKRMKVKNDDNNSRGQTVDITVYEYFAKHCGIELTSSAYLPCLDVGKPKRPVYLPLELCSLVSLQRYTKVLSLMQRASLVEKSRQKPQDRIKILKSAVGKCYDDDPVLAACGISIEKQLNLIEGRVLETPKNIERPYTLIEEEPQLRKSHPVARVERMFDLLASKLNREPKLILCVLPERKICDIYGPWKKKCLSEIGVVTQCIAPVKITNQYLTNVLLKINSKLGGINSLLAIEHSGHLPLIKDTPTMILGMDVSHNSLGRLDSPSIAAVVGSRHWPLISRYRASVRMQASKVEMIDALYKPLENGSDDGIIRELLLDFYDSSNGRKPTQFIVFRDGVSESQFEQVLTIELNQIIKAYQHLGEVNVPQFTVIVAQKKHHIKLFLPNGPENVPPGTVVDTTITHPRNYDFYMCAHAGMLGTSRPVHYHVLLDEIGFSADGLQNLIHSLSYVNQRSTIATSVVAPICYAHHAAAQMGQLLNFDDSSETGSSPASEGGIPIPELPRLHRNVRSSMFFC